LEIIRNLARRKLRTILTISGIVIGIFALTTMGAMAEHFNALTDGGVRYYGASIQVTTDGGNIPLLSTGQVADIGRVEGVSAAYPQVQLSARPDQVSAVNFGYADFIASRLPDESLRSPFVLHVASGQDLSAGTRGQVLLGSDIARELHARTGAGIDLPVRPPTPRPGFVSHQFTVVGILQQTRTEPDAGAYVGLEDAQMLLKDSLPVAIRDRIDVGTLASAIVAYGAPGSSISELDRVADRINREVPGVRANRPSQLVDAFKSGGAVITAVTTAAAVLALVVGGLSVINTMIMAVSERVREIGLKKAVGAHGGRVLREFMVESALIGLAGGLTGYLAGLALTTVLDAAGRDNRLDIFLVTPTLTVIAIGFAVVLGTIAGIVPALRASRLDPVTALRTV
jgi:putative ABC transport system permease protein